MAHVRANVIQFHLKLVEFWSTGKYTDVTIDCDDGTSFKCHRVALASACEYFDTMFSSNFQERTADRILLREISAKTFALVLQFIYSGDVAISVDNVSCLLQASELFKLSDIEDLCVQFIGRNGLTVSDSWNVFVFARATNKQTLVDILSHRVATRFEIFSKDDRFLEVSFDDLSIILKRMSSPLMKRIDGSVLAAVARWIEHKGERSQCYLHALIELIRIDNMSQMYLKFIFTKLLADSTATQSPQCSKGQYAAELLQGSAIPSTERLLHVIVKDNTYKSMKLYSMNSSHICSVSATIPLKRTDHWASAVVGDDSYFYCLKYVLGATKKVSGGQTFYAHTSVNMSSEIKLKSPPVTFPFVRAVAQQNHIIYFYNPGFDSEPLMRSNVSSSFSDEEISRGIYAYNCEVDNWFPVPTMKIKVEWSSLATCGDKLYLIGGREPLENARQSTTVQVYDSRVGKWEELPRTNHEHESAASCFMDGKIYVFGGVPNTKSAERYDLAAGLWENLPPLINGTSCLTPSVPNQYLKQLWVENDGMSFDVYNAALNEWKAVPIITEENPNVPGTIMTVFVFRSL